MTHEELPQIAVADTQTLGEIRQGLPLPFSGIDQAQRPFQTGLDTLPGR